MSMDPATWAVVNPHNKPVEELPIIYGFNNGGEPGWYDAVLVAQDGTYLGSHICSHECFMPGDLGVSIGMRPDRHLKFLEHYPDGYRMQFVGLTDGLPATTGHEGLRAAIEKCKARGIAA
jgi:hypothetical protein